MTGELVSVIIPTFNRLESLRRAAGSLFGQRYQNFELIIVDDASTDCTFEEFASQERVRVIRVEQRGGPSFARNLGILAARGRYVWFLDSDVLLPDAGTLERLVAAYGARPGIGSLGGEIVAHEHRDKAYGRRICWNGKNRRVTSQPQDASWRECDYLATCNCFVLRQYLCQMRGFDERFVFGAEDMDLGYRLRLQGLDNYVSHSLSVMHCHEKTGRYEDETIRYQKTRIQWAKKHFGRTRMGALVLYELLEFSLFYAVLLPKLLYKLLGRTRITRQNYLGGWYRLQSVFTVTRQEPVSMIDNSSEPKLKDSQEAETWKDASWSGS